MLTSVFETLRYVEEVDASIQQEATPADVQMGMNSHPTERHVKVNSRIICCHLVIWFTLPHIQKRTHNHKL